MNLNELKSIVDTTILHLQSHQKPEDIQVLITTSERSLGARVSSGVRSVGLGFDWEHGQFRIEPSNRLVAKGNSLTDVKCVEPRQFEGRNYYFCPRCQQKLNKNDKFCRHCSQKLK